MPDRQLSREAQLLGYAGLLPQAALLAVALLLDPTFGKGAVVIGWAYAALIFSFLGGVWWGIALQPAAVPRWVFAVAILPSLIAFATLLLPLLGMTGWRVPSFVIGLALLLSPLVDTVIARSVPLPAGWLRLRWHLSIGLGVMTVVLGFLA